MSHRKRLDEEFNDYIERLVRENPQHEETIRSLAAEARRWIGGQRGSWREKYRQAINALQEVWQRLKEHLG